MKTHDIHTRLIEAFGDPIGSYAGNAPVGVRIVDEDGTCPACGMMPIAGQCGCDAASEEICDCGMPISQCKCEGHMHEGVEPCEECGMYEVDGACGCTHMEEVDLEEVTPPGHEKMVRGLKKDPSIDNPYAVAWAHHEKYGRPKMR